MNLFIKTKTSLADLENEFMFSRGKGRGRDRLEAWG